VGAAGPYKFTANEVAIGLTIPRAAVEILRQRLTPAHFNRAALLAEPFSPDNAVQAGFLAGGHRRRQRRIPGTIVSATRLPPESIGTAFR
jgi:enoyl-CoA hydratase/carnithine racemase